MKRKSGLKSGAKGREVKNLKDTEYVFVQGYF